MTSSVVIHILDEVNVYIGGLAKPHITLLYDKFGVDAPSFFFNPRYKMGKWDGKNRFFSKNCRTFVYMLEDIIPIIVKLGYSISINDSRAKHQTSLDPIEPTIFQHITHLDTGKPIVLRDDQTAAINALIKDGNGICLSLS